ncbi:MAG: patatin-like phospholipase family protein [Candidatus Solibacter sp.]
MKALVLSAGGLWAAWEIGAWKVLCAKFQPDLIVGTSAGAWNGWAIASGCSAAELAQLWLEPDIAQIMSFGLHASGCLKGAPLHAKARDLFAKFKPRIPFALTMVELPSLRSRIVRDRDITWEHLAATASIPGGFPPVSIGGHLYVDGGFRAGLPLWAAEELGAERALALNVLNTPEFRVLQVLMRRKRASHKLRVTCLEPSRRLGSLRQAICWNPNNIECWMAQGEEDARRISFTM